VLILNVVSIDLGTTYIKVANVFVESGVAPKITKSVEIPTPYVKPALRAYEHNPKEVLKLLYKAVRKVVTKADAIVLSTYLFGILGVDKSYRPLTNVITWVDERPTKALRYLKTYDREIYLRTGCPLLHIYGLPKILWLKKFKSSVSRNITFYLDVKSFITHAFTGNAVTDLSSASGTYQLLNINELRWDAFALELAGIDENQLPELREGYEVLEIKDNLVEELNLKNKTPLILGLYDGATMIYGMTLGQSGKGVVNLGTSAMLRVVTDYPVLDKNVQVRFQTYYLLGRKWISGGGVNNAGIVLDYLHNLFWVSRTKEEFFNMMFKEIEDKLNVGSNVLFIPTIYPERLPLSIFKPAGGGGALIGLKPNTTLSDVFKAAVEGIIFLLKIINDGLIENNVTYENLLIGGKLAQQPIVRKILANVIAKKITYCGFPHVSHVGNALLAFKALRYGSEKELKEIYESMMNECSEDLPTPELIKYYNTLFKKFTRIIHK